MSCKVRFWLVTLLLLAATQTNADSSLQMVLSQKGLQQVTHWLTDWLQNKLSTIELPQYQGGVDIGIGTVKYVLYDMSIQRCDLPEPSVEFWEGTGMKFEVNGLSIVIRGHWKTKFGIIHDSGWFDLAIFTVNLGSMLQLGAEDEHVTISAVTCSANVGSVQANFHGGGSFIFQPFVDMFSGQIANVIRKQICPAFVKAIGDLDSHLAAMSDALKIDPYVYMNISLTDSPIVMASGLGLNVTGEFYSIKHPSEPPFSPNHFGLSWQDNYMLVLGASEFCVNSAAYAYFTAEALQILIREKMIPKFSPVHLNTSQFGVFVPQLGKLYPNMEMEILLYANKTPVFSFTQTVVKVDLFTSAKFSVIKPNSEIAPVFRLDMAWSFLSKAYIDKMMLKGSVEMKNFTMMLGTTEIGVFSVTALSKSVQLVMQNFVLPQVNAQLRDGIQLPFIKGFSPTHSVLTIEDGFVVIATDLDKTSMNI